MTDSPHWKLRGDAPIDPALRDKLERDYERTARDGLPAALEDHLREEYRIEVDSSFAGLPIKNPWGKASGQLSMTVRQVEEDAETGLGFVVLKTVIAQDESGVQTMHEWAIREARMDAERIVGKQSGREGWTISWKGRGWWLSFEEYLDLVRRGAAIGRQADMVVVPSCKYHLPTPDESSWKEDEYRHTTDRLAEAFAESWPGVPMPLEKDFSPTLAGSGRATQQSKILEWLATVPTLVRERSSAKTFLGLKLFNAMFEDEFQLRMLAAVFGADERRRPDYVTFANRLFDPDRECDGKVGIAYGGPDLSDRNLRILDAYRRAVAEGSAPEPSVPISATGDIHSGRIALEYAIRGCSSFQIHTYFQLPAEEYAMHAGTKVAKALHRLILHPRDGFVAWLRFLGESHDLVDDDGVVRFRDVVGIGGLD